MPNSGSLPNLRPLAFILILIIAGMASLANAIELEGRVLRIGENGAIELGMRGTPPIWVELYGIELPAPGQKYAREAWRGLERMLGREKVDVEIIGRNDWGNLMGIVTAQGQNVNRQMLIQGLAWVYPAQCEKDFCGDWLNLQQSAKSAGVGLWLEPNPTPPWEWRQLWGG